MVRLAKITNITTATTLDHLNNTYLVTAVTGATGYTITLPPITTDGMNYQLTREDTLSTRAVTIAPSPGNSIFINLGTGGTAGSGATGTILLLPQTTMEIKSFSNNWYITFNLSLQRTEAKTLFSSAFSSSNGGRLSLGGAGTICIIPYVGSNVERITSLSVVSQCIQNVTLTLINVTAGSIICTGTAFSTVLPLIRLTTITNINHANVPTAPGLLALNFSGAGIGANTFSVYSVTLA